MRLALAEYAALDAVLIIRGGRERGRRMIEALQVLGIPAGRASALKRGDRMEAVAMLHGMFSDASETFAERADDIAEALLDVGVAQEITPNRAATRLAAIGVPIGVGLVLSQAMGQAVNIQANDCVATISLKDVLEDAATGRERRGIVVEVHLPSNIMWRQETGQPEAIRLGANLPQTVLTALPGMRVDAVFEHPILTDDPPVVDAACPSGPWTLLLLRDPHA